MEADSLYYTTDIVALITDTFMHACRMSPWLYLPVKWFISELCISTNIQKCLYWYTYIYMYINIYFFPLFFFLIENNGCWQQPCYHVDPNTSSWGQGQGQAEWLWNNNQRIYRILGHLNIITTIIMIKHRLVIASSIEHVHMAVLVLSPLKHTQHPQFIQFYRYMLHGNNKRDALICFVMGNAHPVYKNK